MQRSVVLTACLVLWLSSALPIALQERIDVFVTPRDHPAIAYSTGPLLDPIALLNAELQAGRTTLEFNEGNGYLESALDVLGVPVDSQSLVFSATSAQANQISMKNPRALYFNDTVSVGWVRGGSELEVAAHDPRQGTTFYSLEQRTSAAPRFVRGDRCLACHLSWDTLGVPGMLLLSTFRMSDDPRAYASGVTVDHRTPLFERWGGWYVTGRGGTSQHLGNAPVVVSASALAAPPPPTPRLDSLEGTVDLKGFPTPCSDIAAQMVLAHQVRMTNLMTRLGWEVRVAQHGGSRAGQVAAAEAGTTLQSARVRDAVSQLVDYMFFVDEAPLESPIRSSCGFAKEFSSRGPRDSHGRSLRELDLETRLMRYPLSYMVYTPAFDALPAAAKTALYARMGEILRGDDRTARYASLSAGDRAAILEILGETKADVAAALK